MASGNLTLGSEKTSLFAAKEDETCTKRATLISTVRHQVTPTLNHRIISLPLRQPAAARAASVCHQRRHQRRPQPAVAAPPRPRWQQKADPPLSGTFTPPASSCPYDAAMAAAGRRRPGMDSWWQRAIFPRPLRRRQRRYGAADDISGRLPRDRQGRRVNCRIRANISRQNKSLKKTFPLPVELSSAGRSQAGGGRAGPATQTAQSGRNTPSENI